MLTFEEFFAKKKTDLVLFQQSEPALFAEFKSEYEQMGEKSFDHSKKFLFNKIRRAYHLKTVPGPGKDAIEITKIASQAEPLSSPTIEQKPTYTPKFKPRTAVKPDTESPPPLPADGEAATPPVKQAYQPRFKMQSAVPKPEESTNGALPETEEKKPAYKPKFNMKNVQAKPAEEASEESPEAKMPEIPKPAAYKPKFNMKNIKPKPEE